MQGQRRWRCKRGQFDVLRTGTTGDEANFRVQLTAPHVRRTRMEETRTFYRDIMKFPIETDLEHSVSFRATLLTLRPREPWIVCDYGQSTPGSAVIQLAFRVPPPVVVSVLPQLGPPGSREVPEVPI